MKLQRAVTFMLFIFLLSCESPGLDATESPENYQHASPPPVPTSTLAPPVNVPMEISTPVPVPPTSTIVDFLVDKSTSVDNSTCDKSQKRFEFVNFMVNSILAPWTSPTNDGALYIGASQFGKGVLTSYEFSNIKEIMNFDLQKDDIGTDDTEIATGIQDEIARMGFVEAQKRILIVLTDGQFASQSIKDVDDTLKDSVKNDLSIFFVLVCSKSIDPGTRTNWHDQFDGKLVGVRVFDSLEEAGIELLRDLQKYKFFPLDFAVVPIPYQENIEIPGDAKSVGFSYWSTSEQDLSINMNGVPFVTVFSAKPEPQKNINPKADCGNSQFQIPSISSPVAGILFVTYKRFENIELSIYPQELKILNNQLVQLETVATGLDEVDRFGSWRYCYDIQLVTPPGGVLLRQSCEGNSYECLDEGLSAFRTEWLWTPPGFVAPEVVTFQAYLVDSKNGTSVSNSDYYNALVDFEPIYIGPAQLIRSVNVDFPENSFLQILTSAIPFEFVVNEPEIYLVSSKSPSELVAITNNLRSQNVPFMACPSPEADARTQIFGDSVVHLTDDYRMGLELKKIYANVKISEPDKINPLSRKYGFNAYSYVVSECGYTTIIFTWSGQDGMKASTWVCRIEIETITCEWDQNYN